MFHIDISSGVAIRSDLRLGDSKTGLADDVAQAYKQITFSIHIYPYTPLKNIDFVRSS